MSEHHDRDARAGVRHAMRRGCAISARRFRLTMLAENVVQQAVFNKNVGSESSPTGDSAKSLEKYAASAEGGHGVCPVFPISGSRSTSGAWCRACPGTRPAM